nr:flagellar filament capping protein FliD [Desulfurispira natronophila]
MGVSGLPTGDIMDQMMEVRSQRIGRLLDDREKVELKKSAFMNVNNDLMGLRNQLLDMNLQSTFLNREVSSSNEALVSATAGANADKTSHTVDVTRIARAPSASSHYTRATISQANIKNTTNISGVSSYYEGMLSAKHDINVSKIPIDDGLGSNIGNYAVATNRITVDNKPTMLALMGESVEKTDTDKLGQFDGTIAAGQTLSLSVNGKEVTIEFEEEIPEGTSLATVANILDTKINDALNAAHNTRSHRYVAVGDSGFWGAGQSGLNIYNTELTANESLEITGGTAQAALGFDTTATTRVDEIVKSTGVFYADEADAETAMEELRQQMGQAYSAGPPPQFNSIVDGTMNFQAGTGGLQEGNMRIITGNELRLGERSYSKVNGAGDIGTITPSESLSTAGFDDYNAEDAKGYFTINGVRIDILQRPEDADPDDPDPDPTVNEILGAINSSNAGVTASFDTVENRFILTANEANDKTIRVGEMGDTSNFLEMAGLTVNAGAESAQGSANPSVDPTLVPPGLGISKGIFTINGVSIYVTERESLNDMIDKINNSGAGVIANYDTASDTFSITGKLKEGKTNQRHIEFGSENDTSNFLRQVNLIQHTPEIAEANGYDRVTREGERGEDALFSYNGVMYSKTVNEIEGMPGGIDLDLKGPTQGAITLNVTGETDTALDRVADFIANYNTVMERVTPFRLSDEERRFLEPLSPDKMAGMTFNEQDEYMEKYRQFNEQEFIRKSSESRTIASTLRRIATDFYGDEGSSIRSLGDMGIEVAGKDNFRVLMKGMLLIDSTDRDEIKEALKGNTRFMSAISNNEEEVYNLFAKQDSDGNPIGLSRKLEETVNDYVFTNGLIQNKVRTGGFIDREMDRVNQSIEREQRSLQRYEESLRRQFAMLERRMSDLDAQSSAIMGMVNQGGQQ